MTKKPGILDPWRQNPPPPLKANLPGPVDPDSLPEERCVTYSGDRAGLNVWIDARDPHPEQTALTTIASLLDGLRHLKDPAVTAALQAHGLAEHEERVAVEPAAMAIRRALVTSPKAAALIAKNRVKAFVR